MLNQQIWSPSQLTVDRPDIWCRALDLAQATTGMVYIEKKPLPDGTIHACGGSYYPEVYDTPRKPHDPLGILNKIRRKRDELNRHRRDINKIHDEIEDLINELKATPTRLPAVFVPSGAMEWLLHEVGHWVASSDMERNLPNYGDSHELSAYAFEDYVFGQPSRLLVVPTQRDNFAFDLSSPLPQGSFLHIDRRLRESAIDLCPFKDIWGEWVSWGRSLGDEAPWLQAKN